MKSHEREELSRFLGQLTDVRLTDKDAEAEALIREAVARQPDAAYLLVQRAMLVEQALNTAKARIAELQQARRAESRPEESGFLGGRNPWAPPSESAGPPGPVPGAGTYRVPASAAAVGGAPMAASGGGSFLGNVATTAAGVVAGSFLFQGLENLMGHHHGGGSSWTEPGGEHLAEQTVINNYYGSAPEDGVGTAQAQDARFASDLDDGYADDSADDSDWI